jgi:hypothetical protein
MPKLRVSALESAQCSALQGELIQFRQIFFGAERSGRAALAKINLTERSVGAVTLKIFGAERSG